MGAALDFEPDSPLPLEEFHAWCRSASEFVVANNEIPKLLFADSADLPELLVVGWELEGEAASIEHLLTAVLPRWIDQTEASAVGICVPLGGDEPAALLVTIDETGASAARAYVALVDEAMQLGEWSVVAIEHLPVEEWQRTLATNAGYEDFAKWRCIRCESVCPGEMAIVPAPCEFCGGDEIEQVAITTPLADPRPPYDEEQRSGMPRDR